MVVRSTSRSSPLPVYIDHYAVGVDCLTQLFNKSLLGRTVSVQGNSFSLQIAMSCDFAGKSENILLEIKAYLHYLSDPEAIPDVVKYTCAILSLMAS